MSLSAYTKTMAHLLRLSCLAVAALCLASCDWYHEDNDECSVSVRLTYDMNMKFVDAFDNDVEKVTLYAVDENGAVAYSKTVSKSEITNGVVTLDGIKPGNYDILVWAEGEERNANSFTYGTAATTGSAVEGLTSYINRNATTTGKGDITKDLTPLFHGYAQGVELTNQPNGQVSTTIDLTKNTNVIRVTLQDYNGQSDIDASKYTFRITDDNGFMNYDNSLLADDSLTYHPWSTYAGKADITASDGSSTIAVAIAEFTVGRLMVDKHPRLSVYDEEGQLVLSVPLIDYLLLVKGKYNKDMSDQEYLDRQDEYDITFFLKGSKWVAGRIIINSWHLVMSDVNM